jgi:transglutaminase-like putative cysteine protease
MEPRVKRRFAIVGRLTALAVAVFIALPAALLMAPQKLRDYAYRELAYRVIADEVTKEATSDAQFAASLLAYVSGHETASSSAQVVDDTVFNDLVRGIGFCDQQAWGLSTLLAKKHVPATLLMLRGRQQVSQHSVATVFLNGKWRVLDPYYQRLLAEYPASPHAEDGLYFLDKWYEDQRQWQAAGRAFDELLARIGPRAKWVDAAHYFNGVANEAQHNYPKAASEYMASASAEQTDSAVRLSAMGAGK